MVMLFTIAATLALVIAILLATAPRDGFRTEILIAAQAETIWDLLTDPAEHVAWNPTMSVISGRFVPGERISLTMRTPSGGNMTFRPRVLVADPGRELRWLGRVGVPRLFDGEHYFILISERGGTRLVQGEHFRGLLLWFIDIQKFRPAFVAANEALRLRAQAMEPACADKTT